MQARISVISTWIVLALASAARASEFHEDGKAGIRFPIPFADAEVKTGTQVTALVLADGKVRLPDGVEITSGVYGRAGAPYLIVWTKPEARPPTQKEVLDLASAPTLGAFGRKLSPWLRAFPPDLRFDRERLRATGSLVPTRGRVRSKVLLQVTKAASVYVGFFFTDPSEAAMADAVESGMTVLPGRGIRYAELAPGGLALRTQIVLACVLLGCLVLFGFGRLVAHRVRARAQASAQTRP